MSELERILHAYQGASAAGHAAALASVVSVSGSTYRRIGAHMLVTEEQNLKSSRVATGRKVDNLMRLLRSL
jgi:xanthine/CO dehydrogenase XdhC/CoxF family maturation factor